jgi:hypothetical protein
VIAERDHGGTSSIGARLRFNYRQFSDGVTPKLKPALRFDTTRVFP